MLSLNSQMPKSSKTRKMSNFQMLSNSADFKKTYQLTAKHSTPHNHQDKSRCQFFNFTIFQEIINF